MPRLGVAPTAYHIHAALKCCVQAGELRAALELLEYADEVRVSPDGGMIELGLSVCARTGDARRTLRLLKQLSLTRLPLNERMRCSTITAFGRAGEGELAMRFLTETSDVACHNAALSALLRAGKAKDARALLERMRQQGPPPDRVTVQVFKQLGGHEATSGDSGGGGEFYQLRVPRS